MTGDGNFPDIHLLSSPSPHAWPHVTPLTMDHRSSADPNLLPFSICPKASSSLITMQLIPVSLFPSQRGSVSFSPLMMSHLNRSHEVLSLGNRGLASLYSVGLPPDGRAVLQSTSFTHVQAPQLPPPTRLQPLTYLRKCKQTSASGRTLRHSSLKPLISLPWRPSPPFLHPRLMQSPLFFKRPPLTPVQMLMALSHHSFLLSHILFFFYNPYSKLIRAYGEGTPYAEA